MRANANRFNLKTSDVISQKRHLKQIWPLAADASMNSTERTCSTSSEPSDGEEINPTSPCPTGIEIVRFL